MFMKKLSLFNLCLYVFLYIYPFISNYRTVSAALHIIAHFIKCYLEQVPYANTHILICAHDLRQYFQQCKRTIA